MVMCLAINQHVMIEPCPGFVNGQMLHTELPKEILKFMLFGKEFQYILACFGSLSFCLPFFPPFSVRMRKFNLGPDEI